MIDRFRMGFEALAREGLGGGGKGVSEREGVYDVLPSGGVSSAMQQAADQYYTKIGPVRDSVLLFKHFKY
jgi:hypothetical protein